MLQIYNKKNIFIPHGLYIFAVSIATKNVRHNKPAIYTFH